MKRVALASSILFGMLAVAIVAVLLGRAMAPTVEVRNLSDRSIEAFVVELPTSRVSIGPIAPGGAGRVFFAPQAEGGSFLYRVTFNDGGTASGGADYAKDGQWFRTLRFDVGTDGSIDHESDG